MKFIRVFGILGTFLLFPGLSHALSCSSLFGSGFGSPSHSSQKKIIIIVDPYSSARFLAPEFKKYGYDVIAIHSRGQLIEYFKDTFIPEDFATIYAHRDLDTTMTWIRGLPQVAAIIPGAEPGVLLADQLTHRLGLELRIPDNGENLARRDKFLMQEVIRSAGIRAIHQMRSEDLGEIFAWIDSHDLWKNGVVLKPLQSGGTDGVFFCHSREDVEWAFEFIKTHKNAMGDNNVGVLVQEKINGIEYVVNTVSRDGVHKVTDFWKYFKWQREDGVGAIYDRDELLPSRGQLQDQLRVYTFRVLDALGIRTGWGHAEVMMTDTGPVLIEIGARMMGSGQPRLVADALGHSQIDLGVLAYIDPQRFFATPDYYELKQHAVLISLSTEGGRPFNDAIVSEIKSLPGYVRHGFPYKPGQTTEKTIDLHTALGQIELAHENLDLLNRSVEIIRKFERQRRFEN